MACADDITPFTRNNEDLTVVHDLYNQYGQISRAKLDANKCKALVLGEWDAQTPRKIPVVESTKILGIIFNARGVSPTTWTEIIPQAKKRAAAIATFVKRDYIALFKARYGCRQSLRAAFRSLRAWKRFRAYVSLAMVTLKRLLVVVKTPGQTGH